jgi:O-antigen/teichoic acid export membrane protein
MRVSLRGNAVAGTLEQVILGLAFLVFYGLLIRIAGAELVGVLSLVLVLASIGSMTGAGFASALSHFVPLFEGRGDRAATVDCVQTTLFCTAGLYALMLGVSYVPFTILISDQAGADHAGLVPELMIPATLHVFFLGVGATTTLALTALHRSDLRLWATLAGAIVGLTVLFGSAFRFGILAGAWALVAQSGTIAIVSWFQLSRVLPELGWLPHRFDRPMAKKLFGLGMNLQVQTLLVSGLEPVTRLLIGQFGSLAAVAYFSMANRFVLQMRALIYSGAQPVLAAFSHARASAPATLASLYRRTSATVGFIAIGIFSATAGAAPFVGEVWIGDRQEDFVSFTAVLALGWLVNTMALPAYFHAYSLGRMTWSLVGHSLLFGLNLVLGWLLGLAYGAEGVVAGMGGALLISGLLLGIGNGRYAPADETARFTLRHHVPLALCALLATAAAIAAYDWLRDLASPAISGVASGIAWAVIVAPVTWFHPARAMLLSSTAQPQRVSKP